MHERLEITLPLQFAWDGRQGDVVIDRPSRVNQRSWEGHDGEVEDDIDPLGRDDRTQGVVVRRILGIELQVGVDAAGINQIRLGAEEEVVDYDKAARLIPGNPLDQVAANKARAAGDEHAPTGQRQDATLSQLAAPWDSSPQADGAKYATLSLPDDNRSRTQPSDDPS